MSSIEETLGQLSNQLGSLVGGLVTRTRLARGSRDVTQQAAQAGTRSAEPTVVTTEQRIETALRTTSHSPKSLAKVVNASMLEVQSTLAKLSRSKQVYNVGSAEYPIWTWRIGDRTSTEELSRVITRLISERPMTTRELSDATGARFSRTSGVMVEILRGPDSDRAMDLGTKHVGRWFLLPVGARPAAIAPKTRRKTKPAGGAAPTNPIAPPGPLNEEEGS